MKTSTFLPDQSTSAFSNQEAFPADFFSRFLCGEPGEFNTLKEPWFSLAREIDSHEQEARLDLFLERIQEYPNAEEMLKAVFSDGAHIRSRINPYATQTKGLAQALISRPSMPFIVKGVVPARSLNIFYGWEGTLKTMLLLDMAFCVALGRRWLQSQTNEFGESGFEVAPTSVLWIDVDNGEDVLTERLAAFARAYQATPSTPIYWMSFPEPTICANKDLNVLIEHAKNMKVGLICIDNLLRIAGVKDENSSEMDTVMANLRKMAEATGAAVVVIHHRTKDSNRSDRLTIRGHSSIAAAADYIFLVKREDNSEFIEVANTKARRRPVAPFSALFTFELEADGESLRTARFFQASAQPSQVRPEQKHTKLIEVLKSQPKEGINQTKFFKAVKGKKATFLEDLAAAIRSGKIREEPGKGRAKLYFLCE